MITKRKLLKFILKNPKCSSKTIADKFFNGDVNLTDLELERNRQYLIINSKIKSFDNWNTRIESVSLNSEGMEFLKVILSDTQRFWIPIIISVVMSVLTLIISIFVKV